jgi:hypothetical protein
MPFACPNVSVLGFGIDLVFGLYLKLPRYCSSWWFGFVPGLYITHWFCVGFVHSPTIHVSSAPHTHQFCLFVCLGVVIWVCTNPTTHFKSLHLGEEEEWKFSHCGGLL